MIEFHYPACQKCNGRLLPLPKDAVCDPPIKTTRDHVFCNVCGRVYKIDWKQLLEKLGEETKHAKTK